MYRLRLRHLLTFLFASTVLLSAGCTTDALLTQLERSPLVQVDGGNAISSSNRLLVVGLDGNVTTMNPDGSDRFNLTADASPQKQYLQPTWSPDGQTVAWTEVSSNNDDETISRLVATSVNGARRASADVPFAPFYLFWSPDGGRLAYLSNWSRLNIPSMALRVAELEEGAGEMSVKTLAEGQPFYFSWGPDGRRMVTHIGNERLELQSVDGDQSSLASSSGDFPTPQWASNGEQLIYAVNDDGLQQLVLTELDGTILNEITDFQNRISFTLNSESDRLAYVVTDANVGLATIGPLYVMDMTTLATREISTEPVIAFFWSPDGDKLAYMTVDNSGATLRLHWYVWDGDTTRDFGRFFPSRTFLERYLVFFDQYAQSMSLWSPTSDAFVYPGVRMGQSGIWVQKLDTEEPARVSRGLFAAWSPQ